MFQISEDNKYLLQQLEGGEDAFCDFKHTINESEKIAKSIVAFANQKGGSLFIGVNDKGEIIGCDPKTEYNLLLEILENYCQPIPFVEYFVYTIDGNDVLEIAIEEGDKKPYTSINKKGKWAIYLRVEDKCIKIGSNES